MVKGPSREEIGAAVDDTERALFGFAASYADGSLGDMDVRSVVDLARRASESVHVAANAFGTDAPEGDTPDALMMRMLGVYAGAAAEAASAQDHAAESAEEASLRGQTRAAMRSVLGLSDREVERMDFDSENGDESPWLLAKERFVFG